MFGSLRGRVRASQSEPSQGDSPQLSRRNSRQSDEAGSLEGSYIGSDVLLPDVTWEGNLPTCSLCQAKVGKRHMNPRHHCRSCGKCICSGCSPSTVQIDGIAKPQRVCKICAAEPRRSPAATPQGREAIGGLEGLGDRLAALSSQQGQQAQAAKNPRDQEQTRDSPLLQTAELSAPVDIVSGVDEARQAADAKAVRRAEQLAAREAVQRQKLEEAQVGDAEISFAQRQAERSRQREMEADTRNQAHDKPLYEQAATGTVSGAASARFTGAEEQIEAAVGGGLLPAHGNAAPHTALPKGRPLQDGGDANCSRRAAACKKACAVQ